MDSCYQTVTADLKFTILTNKRRVFFLRNDAEICIKEKNFFVVDKPK